MINQQQQLQQGIADPLLLSSNSIAQLQVAAPAVAGGVTPASDPLLPEAVGHALKNVAQATNISAEALLASIQLRQQQVLYQQQKQLAALAAAATSSTTTASVVTNPAIASTSPPVQPSAGTNSFTNHVRHTFVNGGDTSSPDLSGAASGPVYSATANGDGFAQPTLAKGNAKQQQQLLPSSAPSSQKYTLAGVHKVMNAPKEYYPVNYDKNFDDNFTSRVELPDTSFSCGSQKHFPGLYADEDLSCMVSDRNFLLCGLFSYDKCKK